MGKFPDTAQGLLAAADHEFMAGNDLQGSEKMREAAARAVLDAARQRGWSHSNREDLSIVAQMLSEEAGDLSIIAGFSVADMFRANSQIDFMEDFQIDEDQRIVRDFVNRILELVN